MTVLLPVLLLAFHATAFAAPAKSAPAKSASAAHVAPARSAAPAPSPVPVVSTAPVPSALPAPSAALRAEVAPQQIHVGDRVAMAITVQYGAPLEPAPPSFGPAGDFEILYVSTDPVKKAAAGRSSLTYRLQLTTFSTGTVTIPPLPIYFRNPDGSFLEARTDPIPITVKSLLQEKGDLGGLRPAKGLYNVRSWLWLWIALGVLALVLILWAVLRRRGVVSGLGGAPAEPLMSPEDEARQALDALQAEPVTEENLKEFYFRLSVILRRYVDRRYNLGALEMTTSELVAAFRRIDLPMSASLSVREFLDNADLVKFAKMTPPAEEVPLDVTRVRAFIDETKPKVVAPEEQKAAEEAPPV